MRGFLTTSILCAVLLGASCSVVRRIPEGRYLVSGVKIEADRSTHRRARIASDQLEKYLRQTPNKRFLGTNFYVWIWQHTDSAKNNWWNRLKHRMGEEPVLLDMGLTEQSSRNLKGYLDYRGFFASQASYQVDTTSRRKRARVTYRTVQGPAYRIRTLDREVADPSLERVLLPDTTHTLLRAGERLDLEVLDAERTRIASALRARGHYDFSAGDVAYVVDTLSGGHEGALSLVIRRPVNDIYRVERVDVFPNWDGAAAQSPAWRAELDTIPYRGLNVVYHPDDGRPMVRPRVLRQVIPIRPRSIFDARRVDETYNRLVSMGYFKSANILFTERADSLPTGERYLLCDIRGLPALRQSYKVEVEGSYTPSFWGTRATLGYQNRNIFRGAESFDAAVSGGYEYMIGENVRRRHATELGLSVGLQFPRFLLLLPDERWRMIRQPRTRLSLGFTYQNRPYYRRNLSSVSWGYSWSNSRYTSYLLRPVDINVVDVRWIDGGFLDGLRNRSLRESYSSQLIAGLSFGVLYNDQARRPGGAATIVRLNVETAGNLVDGLAHAFLSPTSAGHYNVFNLRYAQYARADLGVSHKWMLSPRLALAGRLYGGYGLAYGNSEAIPFDRQFYSGGANGMRGWSPRTLGPGATPAEYRTAYPAQVGDMKLEANVELRFPIWGIFHGATFLDAGNIWFADASAAPVPEAVFHFQDFHRQIALDTGVGVRLDVKFAVIRLDWGIQLHHPGRPAGQRWIRSFDWGDTALNFGVGYPF